MRSLQSFAKLLATLACSRAESGGWLPPPTSLGVRGHRWARDIGGGGGSDGERTEVAPWQRTRGGSVDNTLSDGELEADLSGKTPERSGWLSPRGEAALSAFEAELGACMAFVRRCDGATVDYTWWRGERGGATSNESARPGSTAVSI